LAVSAILLAVSVFAQSKAEIKERMDKRLPRIVTLKEQGVIGEDNKGFLAFVGQSKDGADVVAEENKDRETVYKNIAAQQGASPADVGKRRATQLAERCRKGEWFQDVSGKWTRK
jgi:uncharacterized protein YdbL (DUF1318 family)